MHQKKCSKFWVTFLVLFSSTNTLTQSDRHVRSIHSSPESCSHRPCFTLEEYVRAASMYFTTGSTFIFMAGQHSTRTAVNLTDVSDITFRGENSSSTHILCKNNVTVWSNNVTNWLIEDLAFTLPPSNSFSEPSALKVMNSKDVQMNRLIFRGSGYTIVENTVRAVSITNSSVTATSCLFAGNTGNDGGAIYALDGSSITLNGNVFRGNVAKFKGGAIFARNSMVVINGILADDFAWIGNDDWLELLMDGVTTKTLGIAYFVDNVALSNGGALSVADSNVTVNATIVFRNNSAHNGGGIYGFNSQVTSVHHHLYFIDNGATYRGGAICAEGTRLLLGTEMKGVDSKNSFLRNYAQEGGGIYCKFYISREMVLMSNSCFTSNSASSKGGAIFLEHGLLTLAGHNAQFLNNTANLAGGALFLAVSNVIMKGKDIKFEGNSAEDGGAIYSVESELIATAAMLNFIGNIARKNGGGLYVQTYNNNSRVEISGNFTGNTASGCGGAGYFETGRNIHLVNFTATGNAESAVCILESRVTFGGPVTHFSKNTGRLGGGIRIISRGSFLSFWGHAVFDSNSAFVGGAIYSPHETSVEFNGHALFAHNTADTDGGALYALSTNISFNFNMHNIISFKYNSAENGGAIFLGGAAFIRFAKGAFLNTSQNRAYRYGGAIYYEDSAVSTQCSFGLQDVAKITELPYCFMRFTVYTVHNSYNRFDVIGYVQSYNDSAGVDGSFMYGGLLDRCQLPIDTRGDGRASIVPYAILKVFFEVHKSSDITRGITSKPYRLCFCEDNEVYNCSDIRNVQIYRGQRFNLFLLAVEQMANPIKTQITAKISETARLKVNQSLQPLEHHCSKVSYNLYSTEDYEQLVLYPDGPCRDTGLARAVVNVTILPCPDGFEKWHEQCVCEERLRKYGADCTIDESIVMSRKADTKIWMSGLYENETYLGLILHKTCPLPYCKTDILTLSIDNSDVQCAYNRSGLLCGACATNYSLVLGSSRCEECSNTYLALLLPFAAAGIALVVFLSILRLTVATGMINSIILYANIIQVNKRLFLHTEEMNVLTVFIAWLNLDLGFKTCFYDGMTAYAQTWLQFAFPLYVWVLISLIILISRYSIIVSKLIGHNPIAVLATLLLMSYTKVLNVVIDACSFTNLDYPGNSTVTVWLKDANVPYLKSWHLLLTVATSLVLVFLFLPYTLLLLLGYKLYRFSGKGHFRWINRLKPLLESYYAPYNKHTRYWTGFLLLVRCALYIVFSFNPLGAQSKSLLAINTTFTGIVIIAWLSAKIYKNLLTNVVEASIYLNLVILSASTSNGVNSAALVYSLIGIVFVTMIGIIVYHFHITYTAKSAIWMKVTAKSSDFRKKLFRSSNTIPPVEALANSTPQDSNKMVTKTVIELREPLLEK